MIDWNAAKFILDLIALALAIGAWVYAWRIKHSQVMQGQIERLKGQIAGHEIKLVTLTERQSAMPSHADLEQIHGRIGKVGDSVSDIRTSVSGLVEAVNGLRRAVDTLHNHHLGTNK